MDSSQPPREALDYPQSSAKEADMKWITRKNIKVDRVACPWLIRRFVDAEAEFLFVEEDRLLETAAREQAIPFDAPRLPQVELNHRGERCSFEAIIEDYQLDAPGLRKLAAIVRAADVKGQRDRSTWRLKDRGCARSRKDSPLSGFPTNRGWRKDSRCMTPCTNMHDGPKRCSQAVSPALMRRIQHASVA
jgi:hypothetical protein